MLIVLSVYCTNTNAQKLLPGFDPAEYIEMLKICAKNYDREATKNVPAPENFKLIYRSPAMGLDNAWELWSNDNSIAVISIRPTVQSNLSLLANMYSSMLPSSGEIKLNEDTIFTYTLAKHPHAAIHTGYLIAMAYLSQNIIPHIKACYESGIKDFYITGHSQGAAVSILLNTYLYHLQQQNDIPADIYFKTYCSAPPKVGNLYFANEYEYLMKDGWSYCVINTDDWVPEMPFTLQTVNDFVEANPFCKENALAMIKEQKFPQSLFLRQTYNNIDKPTRKTLKKYQKYMGDRPFNQIKKQLTGLEIPEYYPSIHYVRTGQTIILMGDGEYYDKFPTIRQNILIHHQPPAYLYLAEKMLLQNATNN